MLLCPMKDQDQDIYLLFKLIRHYVIYLFTVIIHIPSRFYYPLLRKYLDISVFGFIQNPRFSWRISNWHSFNGNSLIIGVLKCYVISPLLCDSDVKPPLLGDGDLKSPLLCDSECWTMSSRMKRRLKATKMCFEKKRVSPYNEAQT